MLKYACMLYGSLRLAISLVPLVPIIYTKVRRNRTPRVVRACYAVLVGVYARGMLAQL